MQMLSHTTLANISFSLIAGSSNSSKRKSFFPYKRTARVFMVLFFCNWQLATCGWLDSAGE
jgi:hypothetical protein